MTSSEFQWLALLLWISTAFVDAWVDWLDYRSFTPDPPDEMRQLTDATGYRRAKEYQGAGMRFGVVRTAVQLAALLGFFLSGGFGWADGLARSFGFGPVLTGLAFCGILGVLRLLLQLPFSVYSTFVIEERFGFNKTSPRTFLGDLLKGLLLGAVLGGVILGVVFLFFERVGPWAWLYSWIALSLIQLLLLYLGPAVLLPLFNRFTPLSEGPLREAIREYVDRRGFKLEGIYTMDGSKRSSKANAFFTGFGKLRRLVLFDTLIAKQSTEELVAVLAHEVGHYERRHILKFTILSLLSTGVVFWLFSFFVNNPELTSAFGVPEPSVYASLVFISLLYSPVSRLPGLFTLWLSRRFEFEADEFAAATYGHPEALASALKKLSVDHLSNLTPHPLKVALEYSHPPVLARVHALRRASDHSPAQRTTESR